MATTQVEVTAATVHPRVAWEEERRGIIGGSEVYELLNFKQYGKGCVRALAYRKLGVPPDYPEELDADLMERGHILEPVAARMYMKQTKRRLRSAPSDPSTGMPRVERHPGFAWAGVHVDRTVLAGHGGVIETGDAEIKSHAEGPYWRIVREGLPYGHLLQLQWANFVKRHNWGAFIIVGVFGSMPLKHFDLPADRELHQVFMQEGENFARQVWGKGELPDPPFAHTDDRCKVCPFRMTCRGEQLDAQEAARFKAEKEAKRPISLVHDNDLLQLLADRETIKAELKALDSDKEDAPGALQAVEERIIARLTETGETAVIVDGAYKVYLDDGKWYGLDFTKLKADYPEVYEKCFVSARPTGNKLLRVWPVKLRVKQ